MHVSLAETILKNFKKCPKQNLQMYLNGREREGEGGVGEDKETRESRGRFSWKKLKGAQREMGNFHVLEHCISEHSGPDCWLVKALEHSLGLKSRKGHWSISRSSNELWLVWPRAYWESAKSTRQSQGLVYGFSPLSPGPLYLTAFNIVTSPSFLSLSPYCFQSTPLMETLIQITPFIFG